MVHTFTGTRHKAVPLLHVRAGDQERLRHMPDQVIAGSRNRSRPWWTRFAASPGTTACAARAAGRTHSRPACRQDESDGASRGAYRELPNHLSMSSTSRRNLLFFVVAGLGRRFTGSSSTMGRSRIKKRDLTSRQCGQVIGRHRTKLVDVIRDPETGHTEDRSVKRGNPHGYNAGNRIGSQLLGERRTVLVSFVAAAVDETEA